MTSSLDCYSQSALMLSAVAGDTTRKDLTSLGNVSLQLIGILVIDYIILTAEYANFLSSADAAFLSHRSIGSICLVKSHFSASYLK